LDTANTLGNYDWYLPRGKSYFKAYNILRYKHIYVYVVLYHNCYVILVPDLLIGTCVTLEDY